jgi:hypothetical protein
MKKKKFYFKTDKQLVEFTADNFTAFLNKPSKYTEQEQEQKAIELTASYNRQGSGAVYNGRSIDLTNWIPN